MASDPRGEPHFFVLEDDMFGRYDTKFFQAEPDNTGEAPECPVCGGAIGALAWLPPYRVELERHGEAFGDFVRGPGDSVLISERFAEAFRGEGLTPCIGRAAVDEARSRVRRVRAITCPECRYGGANSIHGFALEPGSWQGEDIFHPRGLYGQLVVSERFAELAQRRGLTNIKLIPIEEFVWDPLGKGPPEAAPAAHS